MKIPFNTHTIYVTLDDDKFYELKSDYTKIEVPEFKIPSPENQIVLIHKKQFDSVKANLLDKENPFKLDLETANIYYQIGFLSDSEFKDFIVTEHTSN
ncbi:hypothetical protein [Sporosarcina sp. FSL K6-1508]|uniref:hypothetical protein n=1 Tax=Sporosarcina sp. FSL K6-1508 TaxID=2921553 RepID=UPI0030F7C745